MQPIHFIEEEQMSQTPNYWNKVLNRRLTRRRSLAALGGSAAAAAFLAACGGDDDSGGSSTPSGGSSSSGATPTGSSGGVAPTEEPGILAKREDTSSKAVAGGTLITDNPAEPSTFDPHFLTLPGAAAVSLIYNKLFGITPGILEPTAGEIEPDLAESWEYAADHLTLTVKIRQNAGTPPDQAPLNGRNLDAEDVLYSWNRWAEVGNASSDLMNFKNPAAPVLSLEATDKNTIVLKLAKPSASLQASLASQLQGQFFILPRESENDYDPRSEPKGAGAYYLSEHIPSSRLVYKRNPNNYDNLSYPEEIDTPIITETAQVVAQLVAGQVYTHYTPVSPNDVLIIKGDAPDIGLYSTDIANKGVTVFFGFKAGSDDAKFRDVRLRQAFSMAMDRDLYADVVANVSKFGDEGLPVEVAWNAALAPSDYAGWWLDPQGPDFGENAKFYQHNIAEAKKLLTAAGYPDGVEVIANYISGTGYGPAYHDYLQPVLGMGADAGFKFKETEQNYQTNWPDEFRDSHGYFDGLAFRLTPVPAEPREALFSLYNQAGSLNYGFDPDGKGVPAKDGPYLGDPTCDDLTSKLRITFDNNEAISIAHELQQYLGKQQYIHRALASATGFDVAWPAVRNYNVFNGLTWGYAWKRYWIDKTQAPLA
jgi:ABC-type transport system substrate-binding protein